LPALTDFPDAEDTVVETIITEKGGRISSPDGRVTLEFSDYALTEPTTIRLKKEQMWKFPPPSPDAQPLVIWRFDAETDKTSVHQFAAPVRITARFDTEDLTGREPSTLALWSYEEKSATWTKLPSAFDRSSKTLAVDTQHFSVYGASAEKIVNLAPLLDGKNVNTYSGAASFSVPVELPPGRGGLTPGLSLTYDSGRLGEMRQYTSVASWAGQGWDLSVGSIQVEYDPNLPARVFLDLGGFGGELLADGMDGSSYIWRARDEQYVRIRTTCNDFTCPWVVTDKRGTRYTFWPSRYYRESATVLRQYRFDLGMAQDVHGNIIEYIYDFVYANDEYGAYIVAGYPKEIRYNGGLMKVVFQNGSDTTCGPTDPYNCRRNDIPYSVTTPCAYTPMRVREMRNLDWLDVIADGQRIRRYDFSYNTTNFDPCTKKAGDHTLTSLSIRDENASANLLTMNFTYQPKPHSFVYNGWGGSLTETFNWQHLTQATNGVGGAVVFDYAEQPPSAYWDTYWTRQAVVKETKKAFLNQPDMTTAYAYNSRPKEQDYPNPHARTTRDDFNAEFRGYGQVIETDAVGNSIVHNYFTSENREQEILRGREILTIWRDSAGTYVQNTWRTFTIREIAFPPVDQSGQGCFLGPPNYAYDCYINFVAQTREDVEPLDGHYSPSGGQYKISTARTFDVYGNLTQEDQLGENEVGGDDVRVLTTYAQNLTDWIFVPKRVERTDPEAGNALLGRTNFYYDGAVNIDATPVKGLLTAVSTQLTTSGVGTVYHTYNASGQRLLTSNPADGPPPGSAGPPLGWIPADVPASATAYDATFGVYPATETNPLGQVTTYTYDFTDAAGQKHASVAGKPRKVETPDGHWTELRYDGFGRITSSWDGLDSESLPTRSFVYDSDLGTLPNIVTTKQRVVHGQTTTRNEIECVDGFGRQVEHREYYRNANFMEVRTDYDARGFKAAQSNPFHMAIFSNCFLPPPAITGVDRSRYEYDALGNLVTTRFVAANQTDGPRIESGHDGKESSAADERGNRTLTTMNIAGRTKQVRESVTTTVLRASGQGSYGAWIGATPHYQQVNETTTNDNTTISSTTALATDTHTYPAAGLVTGTIVEAVIFRFRFKHNDAQNPEPVNDFWPVFYRPSVGQRKGPAQRASYVDGWQEGRWELYRNPLTGAQWTLADVNGGTAPLEFGFQTYSSGSNAAPMISQAWVEIVTSSASTPTTTYAYDKSGQLKTVTDSAGNVTTINYDLAGRKLNMTDPDMGYWQYTYDAAGNLRTQTDARSYVTTMEYDSLQRMTGKTYTNGDLPVNFTYDTYPDGALCSGSTAASAVGRLVAMNDGPAGQFRRSCFDSRGREIRSRRTIAGDATDYNTVRTYDGLDQLDTITFPDGELVDYGMAAQGNVTSITSTPPGLLAQTIASSAYQTPWLAPASMTLANGAVVTSFGYDNRMRLTSIQSGSVQNLALAYDLAGNVTSLTDNIAQPAETSSFSYDTRNRLIDMSINGTPSALYSYDPTGNMTIKQEGSSNLTLSYPTPGAAHPHAVNGTTGTQVLTGFAYDANGNMTAQGTSVYTFDAENRLKTRSVSGGTVSYTYDGNGTLLKKTNADGSWTAYIGDGYEKRSDGTVTKYYQLFGRIIALRTNQNPVQYVLQDHLGSTMRLLDSGGNPIAGSDLKYWPYGSTRSGSQGATDRMYTNQRIEPGDAALGLYNYKARFYSTTLGTFMSADTLTVDGLNRYAYVRGNPLRYNDPSGRCTPGLRALVPGYQCTKEILESFVHCAFGVGSCGGDDANSQTWRKFANWVLGDSEFFARVKFAAGEDRAFDSRVRGIRRTEEIGHYYIRYSYDIYGDPGNDGGLITIHHESGDLEGLFHFYVDYSYLDFAVGGRLDIRQAGTRGSRWVDGYTTHYITGISLFGLGKPVVASGAAGTGFKSKRINDSLYHSQRGYGVQGSLGVNPAEVQTVPLCPRFCSDTSPSLTEVIRVEIPE